MEFLCHYASLFALLYFLLRLLRAVLIPKLLLPFARLTFSCHPIDYWQLVEVVVCLLQGFVGFDLFRLSKHFFPLIGCQISRFWPTMTNHYFFAGLFRILMASLACQAHCRHYAAIGLILNLSFASSD